MNYEWQGIPGFGHLEPMPPRQLDPYGREAVFERIELLRLALDLTMAAFSRRWGITESQYQALKNMTQGLSVPLAHQLCAKTGVDFNYLYRDQWDRLPADLLAKLEAAQEQLDELRANPPTKRGPKRRATPAA